MAKLTTIARAVGSLTSSGVFVDTQTVVVGGKTYTTQATLTNSDGNVFIGADAAATLQNLFDAINLTGTPGTQYAALMTKNAEVRAKSVSATVLVVEAFTPGAIGNLIATTETQTNVAWGGSVLASGSGNISVALREIRQQCQVNSDVLQALDAIDGSSSSEA
jgi:hypothetical protein